MNNNSGEKEMLCDGDIYYFPGIQVKHRNVEECYEVYLSIFFSQGFTFQPLCNLESFSESPFVDRDLHNTQLE
jgi:hypothetical protein